MPCSLRRPVHVHDHPVWAGTTVHTRLVAVTKTSRAIIAVTLGAAAAMLMLAPAQTSTRPARPAPPTTPVPEVVTWCADETKINGGPYYAWMSRRC